MSWIRTVDEENASDELKDLYDRVRDPLSGALDNIMSVHSLDPEGLAAHFALYGSAMRGTRTLRKVDREMIALVVSQINECHYWITHHRRGLRRLLKDDSLLRAIEDDFETAAVGSERSAMLSYAAKLTRAPASVTRSDVDALREVGWNDLDILQMAEVVGYYAYVNRIANGLGVDVEDEAE